MTREAVKLDYFMWALKAECGLLSERLDIVTWNRLVRSMMCGGFWIRVYLVEIEPQPQTGWITKGPSFATIPSMTDDE